MLHASAEVFQSAWFVQSMATQILVIFLIRTPRAAWRDRPSAWLAASSLGVTAFAALLPFLPWGAAFGLVPLPPAAMAMVCGLTLAYLAATEAAKHLLGPRVGLGVPRVALDLAQDASPSGFPDSMRPADAATSLSRIRS